MADEFLYVNKTYLKEILSFQSSKLVGKLLKRFEISNNIDFIKKESKELIYESYRDFGDIIMAYDKGLEMSSFKFNKREANSTVK